MQNSTRWWQLAGECLSKTWSHLCLSAILQGLTPTNLLGLSEKGWDGLQLAYWGLSVQSKQGLYPDDPAIE